MSSGCARKPENPEPHRHHWAQDRLRNTGAVIRSTTSLQLCTYVLKHWFQLQVNSGISLTCTSILLTTSPKIAPKCVTPRRASLHPIQESLEISCATLRTNSFCLPSVTWKTWTSSLNLWSGPGKKFKYTIFSLLLLNSKHTYEVISFLDYMTWGFSSAHL